MGSDDSLNDGLDFNLASKLFQQQKQKSISILEAIHKRELEKTKDTLNRQLESQEAKHAESMKQSQEEITSLRQELARARETTRKLEISREQLKIAYGANIKVLIEREEDLQATKKHLVQQIKNNKRTTNFKS